MGNDAGERGSGNGSKKVLKTIYHSSFDCRTIEILKTQTLIITRLQIVSYMEPVPSISCTAMAAFPARVPLGTGPILDAPNQMARVFALKKS